MYGNCPVCGERYGNIDGMKFYPSCEHMQIINKLNQLTDDERFKMFLEYCTHCGSKDSNCQCANDD
jgi:rRNA maturation protein Nop10